MNIDLLFSSLSKHITLTPEEAEYFMTLLTAKTIEKGGFLLREGEVCKYESFITSGSLKTYYENENGQEHIIDFLIEEWWASDIYSLLTKTPSKKTSGPLKILQCCK